ncbi:MAG: bifunctional proline dehydrogenase/L-glutamate gamma-semialdehyde dehydrogenase PutA [Rhizomicrobium sp.]
MSFMLDWDRLDELKYTDETETLAARLAAVPFSDQERTAVRAEAIALVEAARKNARAGLTNAFLQEYGLDTAEGLALMGLAEALLRIPDKRTRNALIAEKIGGANWKRHIGQSANLMVNGASLGLAATGALLNARSGVAKSVTALGAPAIRMGVATGIGVMGNAFVMSRTIEAALKRAPGPCSFDMLGEGARTTADADYYERLYNAAITTVGKASTVGPEQGHGVSVKLSALGARYEAVREEAVFADLYPRVKRLAEKAAQYDINFTIDAEEADRLVLSLKILERLAVEVEPRNWRGLGLAVQAYQKRAPDVIAMVADLARQTGRRFMVRLVKGAYWDSEVKHAQVHGLSGYPLFTTKAATDLSYLVCAEALIKAAPHIYTQFATHNAYTLAAVRHLSKREGVTIEHQRLHGMGEALYDAAAERFGGMIVRAYAPVGSHRELLPYLVRRLLENGANSSFVHDMLNPKIPVEQVVQDQIAPVEAHPAPHPRLPLPADLYGSTRANSQGRDYTMATMRNIAREAFSRLAATDVKAGPIIGGTLTAGTMPVPSPVDGTTVGHSGVATTQDIDRAAELAQSAQGPWNTAGGTARGKILRAMADALEANTDDLVALLAREAGKTLSDGVAEVREAADFCRYYAQLAETQFGPATELQGAAGETNHLALEGRGVFVCISPWNFPLAIFTGQIAAALAAGNAVLAKPAEQTPLIAAQAVQLFHRAGLDPALLALLPGGGTTVGATLVAHPGIDGVAFTGGTDTAQIINRTLAARDGAIIPFIAETGGLNGMFVDSSALKEQVVDDVIQSAFGSAGQRCSALRMLFLPRERADEILTTLAGALALLKTGDPADPATDVGPVIDAEARGRLRGHTDRLKNDARLVARADTADWESRGSFFAPAIYEVPTPDYLKAEVFGPILHVYRYDPADLENVARAFAASGYGLTLGVHSRIKGFITDVLAQVPAGNVYVNRSVIGAVVGVQPFGGHGLSGTGPKAGGPHALIRYARERAISVNIAAEGGDAKLMNL